ncbi:hypothetical protein NQ318_017758 [Aromia moschata]|uniref:Uncharacterized protein n=1 Tax=Aromia moschata TaxID=1265417 RepID=A0AAV8XUV4_9CUCU|nr:hypothetical protein NQ318_017758 [Aromia moschata]
MSGDTSSRKVKRFSESDRNSDFDAATQKALEEIDVCQNEIDNINEKASEEILKVEQKYNQLRRLPSSSDQIRSRRIRRHQIGLLDKILLEENPYFENAVITKEYHLGCATPTSESTQIIWKEGCTLGQASDTTRGGRKRRMNHPKHFWMYYLVPDVEGDGENGMEQEDGSSSSDVEETADDEENKCATQRTRSP